MKCYYLGFEMPDKWTFRMKKIRRFIMKFVRGELILVPFAGKYRFHSPDRVFIYNDINLEIPADHHVDASLLYERIEPESIDTIIADPPYSHYQAITNYGNDRLQKISIFRRNVKGLLKVGGTYIELGYNSTGIKSFEKVALGICNLGGSHNDILVLVQRKMQYRIDSYIEGER